MRQLLQVIAFLNVSTFLFADWRFDLKNGDIQTYGIFDGGSRGIALIDENKNRVTIYLDRSYPEIVEDEHGFPLLKPMVPREDGLVYLGSECFRERKPINPETEEFKQLVELFDARIAIESARGKGFTEILSQFRNGLDRNMSNK